MVQTYGGGDGSSGNVVERPDQAALPDRRRDLLEGGGRRGGRWQACLLPRGGHGAPNLRKIFCGLVIHYAHGGKRKRSRAKIKIIWKVKLNLKSKKTRS